MLCDVVNVVMVITGYHSDKESSKDYSNTQQDIIHTPLDHVSHYYIVNYNFDQVFIFSIETTTN